MAAIKQRNRQIRWRAAEQIGQHDYTVAMLDRRDCVGNFLAPVSHIVIGADAHGGHVLPRADNMLHRVHKVVGQIAMRDEDQSDHESVRSPFIPAARRRMVFLLVLNALPLRSRRWCVNPDCGGGQWAKILPRASLLRCVRR